MTRLHPGWYAVAFVVYVGLGLLFKTVLLNWIIGPLFLVLFIEVVPRTVRAAAAAVSGSGRNR